MQIVTWNINSVRLRIGLAERLLEEISPDVLCLQETKCQDAQFPAKAFKQAGYPHIAVHGQKGYHGVAIVSRLPLEAIERHAFCNKTDARHIGARLPDGTRLHNFYVPAGGDIPDPQANEKFAHKLAFMEEMTAFLAGGRDTPQIVTGDLNIAPGEHDVWSHRQLLKVVSHTPVETDAMATLMDRAGLVDPVRALVPAEEKLFTWWSYRAKDWRASNRGRRLDHILVTRPLLDRATAQGRAGLGIHVHARDWQRTSDHAPVSLSFAPARGKAKHEKA